MTLSKAILPDTVASRHRVRLNAPDGAQVFMGINRDNRMYVGSWHPPEENPEGVGVKLEVAALTYTEIVQLAEELLVLAGILRDEVKYV